MRRLKIAVVCKEGTANAHYRALVPADELVRRGHTTLRGSSDGSFARRVLTTQPSWDVTLMQQMTGEVDLQAARRLRQLGIAVVWDTDDDIRAIPRSSPAYRRMGGRRGIKQAYARTLEIARTAHLMTTPSDHLAAMYREEGVEHVAVIENNLARDAIRHAGRRRHPGTVIGCLAALEHERDLKRLKIGRTLERILATHEGVSVLAIGCDLGIDDPRYRWRTDLSLDEVQRALLQVDVGIAPLVDGVMTRGRSNVKLKEYAASGAMWLASPLGAYRGMGEVEGGLLVEDGGWERTLSEMITDHERRTRLMARARDWVAGETIAQAGQIWERQLRAAVERARSQAGVTVAGAR
ncbi:hypothetical protein Q5424_05145 [Conexibacter sp. JD483]|uniref:hypothetical protein n=1 Tax=unclassified Conexibacter TaxID=2627773 RepID=UPI0027213970|nr:MULTISPECIES: hypothetical protein [unclassified Conexibacter]MDO8186718.1 hypothetical protein [Conexibacter sp. CPCC 205706]MDO8199004.1 hypothetical protein [Conexibacter sp. CPCC 205762]MDR9368456.1 hypothetical protein [Conexibacter sp. JD483]